MFRTFFAAALCVAAAACVTAVGTAYGPADASGYGYEETRLEDDRYRVTFRGDGATPAGVVVDYALRRAAEIAIADGYDWFRVVGRTLNGEQRGGANIGLGVGSGSYGRRGGVGVGVGGDLGTVGARNFFTSRMEVIFGRGETPEGEDFYDAKSILRALGDETPPDDASAQSAAQ